MRVAIMGVIFGILMLAEARPVRAAAPPWLPRYDMTIHLDPEQHQARVTQRITWFNRHARPTQEIVFNVHSHYAPPTSPIDYLFLAKMLEIMRISARDGIDPGLSACEVTAVRWLPTHDKNIETTAIPFHWRGDIDTALQVDLPIIVRQNESITVEIDLIIRLPQRQGRWGQWGGVTFLSNWHPVIAYYDDSGWQPTPYIPWHQPFYNEAGLYRARIRCPADQVLATPAPVQQQQCAEPGWQEVVIGPVVLRDFSFLASARYRKFSQPCGNVTVNCYAFPEHEHFARVMIGVASRAIAQYSQWIGPYPYAEFSIVESYFGWNGNECSGLIMIDERVFAMPHLAEGYVEYLVSHEVCHQWWYNIIGTDGYRETFMDEAFATHFAHKLLDKLHGRNNQMLEFPERLKWLPTIHREDYRYGQMYGTLHRGQMMPAVQEMSKYGHIGNLFSAVYDRGGKILGLIEARMGEQAFIEFTRRLYQRYHFRVLKVADLRRELAEFTGDESWATYLDEWIHTTDMTDWAIEKVHVDRIDTAQQKPYKTTVIVHQRAERDEPTILGVSFDSYDHYEIRIPIDPRIPIHSPDHQVTIERLDDHRMRIEMMLPQEPKQISIDPDQILPDREPSNNHWQPRCNLRLTPLYTALDETDLTTAYDRWNIIAGPAIIASTYADPWFLRESVIGARAGIYRTQQFTGGVYAGYRPDVRDVAVGFDAQWKHTPFPNTAVGVNVEKSLFEVGPNATPLDRAVLYGRYVLTETASLYLPPIQYAEVFGAYQKNFLPDQRNPRPNAERFDELSNIGFHYHLDYRTPYWDPELGFLVDVTYAAGLPILGQPEASQQLTGQISWIQALPESWGFLGRTRLATRIYGGYATPDKGLFYSLGGSQLLRGYDLAERQGSVLWVASAEWRVPLLTQLNWDYLDHVVGIRNLHLATFYDAGEIFVNGRTIGGVAHSVGTGLRIDMSWFSFIEHTMLRLDVAKTINTATPLQYWIGFQHAF